MTSEKHSRAPSLDSDTGVTRKKARNGSADDLSMMRSPDRVHPITTTQMDIKSALSQPRSPTSESIYVDEPDTDDSDDVDEPEKLSRNDDRNIVDAATIKAWLYNKWEKGWTPSTVAWTEIVIHDLIGKDKPPPGSINKGKGKGAWKCQGVHLWGDYWCSSKRHSCPGCGRSEQRGTVKPDRANWDLPKTNGAGGVDFVISKKSTYWLSSCQVNQNSGRKMRRSEDKRPAVQHNARSTHLFFTLCATGLSVQEALRTVTVPWEYDPIMGAEARDQDRDRVFLAVQYMKEENIWPETNGLGWKISRIDPALLSEHNTIGRTDIAIVRNTQDISSGIQQSPASRASENASSGSHNVDNPVRLAVAKTHALHLPKSGQLVQQDVEFDIAALARSIHKGISGQESPEQTINQSNESVKSAYAKFVKTQHTTGSKSAADSVRGLEDALGLIFDTVEKSSAITAAERRQIMMACKAGKADHQVVDAAFQCNDVLIPRLLSECTTQIERQSNDGDSNKHNQHESEQQALRKAHEDAKRRKEAAEQQESARMVEEEAERQRQEHERRAKEEAARELDRQEKKLKVKMRKHFIKTLTDYYGVNDKDIQESSALILYLEDSIHLRRHRGLALDNLEAQDVGLAIWKAYKGDVKYNPPKGLDFKQIQAFFEQLEYGRQCATKKESRGNMLHFDPSTKRPLPPLVKALSGE